MKKISSLVLFLLFCYPLFGDVLYLNEGEEHIGKLERVASGEISFTELSGQEKRVSTSQVSHVLLSKVRPGDEFDSVASLTDPFLTSLIKGAPKTEDFPDSDYVVLFRRAVFTFQPDGSVTTQGRTIIKILKEAGLGLANQLFYYFPERETLELQFAHTYAPDGRIYHLTDDALSEEAQYPATPEYDKLKSVKFALKKVDIGAIIDVAYKTAAKPYDSLRPCILDKVFGEREPVFCDEFAVEFPQEMEFVIERLNWQASTSSTLSETSEASGTKKILTWKFSDRKGFIPEQNMPATGRIFPHLIIVPNQSWEKLASDFDLAIASSAPSSWILKGFLEETGAASQPTQVQKCRAIYDGILRKIRLVGLAFPQLGDFAPVPTDITLSKRYGSNFARLCLFHHALKTLGIPSYIGLANYWGSPLMTAKLPTLGQALDAVLRIDADGKSLFVHCGSDYLPFAHLPTPFQGAKAFFLKDGRFESALLPESFGEKNRMDRQIYVTLDAKGNLDVNETKILRGSFEVGIRGLRAAKRKELDNYAQNAVKRVHPQAQLTNYGFSDLSDLNVPVVYTLSYRIPEAVIKASDNLMAFKNFWLNYRSSSASLATRTFPMEFSPTQEVTTNIIIELPEKFNWVPWERQFCHDCPCLSYTSNLKQSGRLLIFSDIFKVNQKDYDPSEKYQHYRNCITQMGEVTKQWIILENTSAVNDSVPTVPKIEINSPSQSPVPVSSDSRPLPPKVPPKLEDQVPEPRG